MLETLKPIKSAVAALPICLLPLHASCIASGITLYEMWVLVAPVSKRTFTGDHSVQFASETQLN